MEPDRERVIRYDVNATYARRYNERLFGIHAELICGEVLDLGAKRDNEVHYRSLSNRIDRYISADLNPQGLVNVRADGRQLPFETNQFDTVILSEVLEHVPLSDLEDFLTEVRRVTDPGGHLLANVAFVYPIHGEADFYRPTYRGLENLLGQCGFEPDVTLGGAYVDVLLHVLEMPIRRISNRLPTDFLLYCFAAFHYVSLGLASLPAGALHATIGRNPIAETWYVTQFVVARPSKELN